MQRKLNNHCRHGVSVISSHDSDLTNVSTFNLKVDRENANYLNRVIRLSSIEVPASFDVNHRMVSSLAAPLRVALRRMTSTLQVLYQYQLSDSPSILVHINIQKLGLYSLRLPRPTTQISLLFGKICGY